MVSPTGFEPVTVGIRRTALRGLGCRSDAPKSLAFNEFWIVCVYAVAAKLPVPSLRGDAVVTDGMTHNGGTEPQVGTALCQVIKRFISGESASRTWRIVHVWYLDM